MNTDILIIGAGFAGASTAYHLAQNSKASALIVDQEEVPGYHASGRNASLLLSSVGNREVRNIVAKSCEAYLERREEVGYRPVGSLLLGTREQLKPVRDLDLLESRFLSPLEVTKMVPLLEGHDFPGALFTPSDGVMDISRLLHFYLEKPVKAV